MLAAGIDPLTHSVWWSANEHPLPQPPTADWIYECLNMCMKGYGKCNTVDIKGRPREKVLHPVSFNWVFVWQLQAFQLENISTFLNLDEKLVLCRVFQKETSQRQKTLLCMQESSICLWWKPFRKILCHKNTVDGKKQGHVSYTSGGVVKIELS